MKIILDVNVILSALIRDSTTRKIILNSQFDFYFPEPSLHKIRKYKNYIGDYHSNHDVPYPVTGVDVADAVRYTLAHDLIGTFARFVDAAKKKVFENYQLNIVFH